MTTRIADVLVTVWYCPQCERRPVALRNRCEGNRRSDRASRCVPCQKLNDDLARHWQDQGMPIRDWRGRQGNFLYAIPRWQRLGGSGRTAA